jgi:hypothetical protein
MVITPKAIKHKFQGFWKQTRDRVLHQLLLGGEMHTFFVHHKSLKLIYFHNGQCLVTFGNEKHHVFDEYEMKRVIF